MKIFSWLILAVSLSACEKQPVQQKSPSNSKDLTVIQKHENSFDGPFGLAQGIQSSVLESSFGFTKMLPNSHFYIGKPPKPLDGVSRYLVLATPNNGLCKIVAQFNVENINGEGTQLKEKVDSLKDLLVIKYGDYSDKIDFVTEDVYRRNPNYWTMALLKESATYLYGWTSEKREKRLPSNLKSIDVSASANSISKGSVDIQYEFDNFAECLKETKQEKASNL